MAKPTKTKSTCTCTGVFLAYTSEHHWQLTSPLATHTAKPTTVEQQQQQLSNIESSLPVLAALMPNAALNPKALRKALYSLQLEFLSRFAPSHATMKPLRRLLHSLHVFLVGPTSGQQLFHQSLLPRFVHTPCCYEALGKEGSLQLACTEFVLRSGVLLVTVIILACSFEVLKS